MRRLLLAITVCLIAACAGDSDEGHVRNLSTSFVLTSSWDRPPQQTETIELTLPRGFTIERLGTVAAFDEKGRRFRPKTCGLQQSNDETRVHATFDLAEDSDTVVRLELNEFVVDVQNSRIRRTRPR